MLTAPAYFLPGLSDDDALALWRSFGAKGSRETMLPMLATFDKHPLLVQALASVVAHDRRAVGDFDLWRTQHPDFNPFALAQDQRRSHVLAHALSSLNIQQLRVLQTIAAFRMPTTFETLVTLFVSGAKEIVREGQAPAEPPASSEISTASGSAGASPSHDFDNEAELDAALTELEDRGLLGWDRRANRYDLHPIVRGVVWNNLDNSRRREVSTTLHGTTSPPSKRRTPKTWNASTT